MVKPCGANFISLRTFTRASHRLIEFTRRRPHSGFHTVQKSTANRSSTYRYGQATVAPVAERRAPRGPHE